MIGMAIAWWIASGVLGLAALPAAQRLFSRLPDRGYGLSRSLGILGAGYLFWMGGSLGLLRNDVGGALLGVLGLLGASMAIGRRWTEIRAWITEHWRTAIVMEAVFGLAFVAWVFVRANNPEIANTEKPMELAFLNAILRSSRFPPYDPWLSGHAISYYHFGYILLAFLSRLTATPSQIAFNLGNALWFALTALATYSILYNLLSAGSRRRLGAALLGPLFVLITGNLEGLFEVLHSKHIFWRTQADGALTSRFWEWLNLGDLVRPPALAPSWLPQRFWMWWQASRVVNDVDLANVTVDVSPIDEFPYFSFLLADNHPHLLALPFVLLAVSFALQIFLGGKRGEHRLGRRRVTPDALRWVLVALSLVLVAAGGARAVGAVRENLGGAAALAEGLRVVLLGGAGLGLVAALLLIAVGALPSALSVSEFWVAAWMFGALAFLNTWDWPIYLTLLVGVLIWAGRSEQVGALSTRLLWTGIGLLAAGVVFFLPWYPSFSSQAGGVVPNLAFPTRLPHFLIMFATLLVPLLAWLLWRAMSRRGDWKLLVPVVIPFALFLLSWVLWRATSRPDDWKFLVSAAVGVPLAFLVLSWLLWRAPSRPGHWKILVPVVVPFALLLLSWLLWRTPSWPHDWKLLVLVAVGIPVVLVLLSWLLWRARPQWADWRLLVAVGLGAPLALLLLSWILGGLALVSRPDLVAAALDSFAAPDVRTAVNGILLRRLTTPWTALALGLMLALGILLLRRQAVEDPDRPPAAGRPWAFIGLMTIVGALLVLGPEFLYLKDLFGVRMNTVFKFYFAAWILWGLAAAYVVTELWPREWTLGGSLRALACLTIVLGLVYTVTATWSKTEGFNPSRGRTLDGAAYLALQSPSDYAAILWMNDNLDPGVVAEGVGGSYTQGGRVSVHTGFPTVVGWPWHEVQWRGDARFLGTREDDIRRLYQTRDWVEAEEIISQYGIQYIYVGDFERGAYGAIQDVMFSAFMDVVYQNEGVTIYAARDTGGGE